MNPPKSYPFQVRENLIVNLPVKRKGTRSGSIFLLAKIVKHRFKASKGDFLFSARTPGAAVVLVIQKTRVATKMVTINTMYV